MKHKPRADDLRDLLFWRAIWPISTTLYKVLQPEDWIEPEKPVWVWVNLFIAVSIWMYKLTLQFIRITHELVVLQIQSNHWIKCSLFVSNFRIQFKKDNRWRFNRIYNGRKLEKNLRIVYLQLKQLMRPNAFLRGIGNPKERREFQETNGKPEQTTPNTKKRQFKNCLSGETICILWLRVTEVASELWTYGGSSDSLTWLKGCWPSMLCFGWMQEISANLHGTCRCLDCLLDAKYFFVDFILITFSWFCS